MLHLFFRYWPYLRKVAEELSDLQPLMEMRPFLSVMHAKAHTAKCEVQYPASNAKKLSNDYCLSQSKIWDNRQNYKSEIMICCLLY